MRILMTVASTSLMDGINRHILAIAPALNKLTGVSVAVVTVLPAGDLNRHLEKCGVATFSLDAPHGHSLWALFRFVRVMRTFRPDVVHLHVIPFVVGLALRWMFRKVPCVQTLHGIIDPPRAGVVTWRMRVGCLMGRLAQPQIVSTCFVSEGVRQAWRGLASGSVIYNPIDSGGMDMFDRGVLRAELGIDSQVPVIGTVCRVAEVKDPMSFVKVMLRVLAVNHRVRAVVIGDGDKDLLSEMRSAVRNSDVSDRFHFMGFRADARMLVSDMSCFVLTSHREGMPTALLEAMAAHVPVAFFEGDGGLVDLAEMNIKEGPIAVTASRGDVEALADGIIELMNNPGELSANVDRAYAVTKKYFDIGKIVGKLHQEYVQVSVK